MESLTSVVISFIILSLCLGFFFKFLSESSYQKINNTKQILSETIENKKNQDITELDEIEYKNVYFEIVDSDFFATNEIMNITIRLDFKNTPITAYNFYQLCKFNKFANTPFHRIIKDFMIQGGDITNHDGTGGQSYYGNNFEDENFINKHDAPGILSMANSGKDTNNSQFFILLNPSPHLDGKHVAFGKVVKGMKYINRIGDVHTDFMDRPINEIYIKLCYAD